MSFNFFDFRERGISVFGSYTSHNRDESLGCLMLREIPEAGVAITQNPYTNLTGRLARFLGPMIVTFDAQCRSSAVQPDPCGVEPGGLWGPEDIGSEMGICAQRGTNRTFRAAVFYSRRQAENEIGAFCDVKTGSRHVQILREQMSTWRLPEFSEEPPLILVGAPAELIYGASVLASAEKAALRNSIQHRTM